VNEHILKLAKASGITLRGYPMNPQMIYPDELEKFAGLIVWECIDTVLDCSVEYTTRPQIAEELKEHFGVE